MDIDKAVEDAQEALNELYDSKDTLVANLAGSILIVEALEKIAEAINNKER